MAAKASASKKVTLFKVRAAQLKKGAFSYLPLLKTYLMSVRMMVYAEGGEDDLHCHPGEEHAFIILNGEAVFSDGKGRKRAVRKYEGIFLPMGAFYTFKSTGKENLVLLRIEAGPDGRRFGPDNKPLLYNPSRGYVAARMPVAIPGKFFGAVEA